MPRWVKHSIKKQKEPPCCAPRCSMMAERLCKFASYDVICAAVRVSVDKATDTCPMLMCNAGDLHTRVWLHVVHSAGHKKLLDTDVYHVAVTVISHSNVMCTSN